MKKGWILFISLNGLFHRFPSPNFTCNYSFRNIFLHTHLSHPGWRYPITVVRKKEEWISKDTNNNYVRDLLKQSRRVECSASCIEGILEMQIKTNMQMVINGSKVNSPWSKKRIKWYANQPIWGEWIKTVSDMKTVDVCSKEWGVIAIWWVEIVIRITQWTW